MRLKWTYEAEDILDYVYGPRPACRYGASSLVGAGRNDPYWLCELVVRLSQRLVLAPLHVCSRTKCAPIL